MSKKAILLHRKLQGKIFIESKISNLSSKNLQLIYTPGVASVCKEIMKNPESKYTLTSKGNNIAIITDGTRLLGLGNVGANVSLPVMEGKSAIYRAYGKINAFPICLNTTDKKKIVDIVEAIEPMFGAINLEDIESPKVLEIYKELEKRLEIPVFHDDGQGTAIVTLAGLINALKIVKKNLSEIKIIVAGSGSAGYFIGKLLNFAGCKNIIMLDSKGVIYKNRKNNMTKYKREIAKITNPKEKGQLSEVIKNADVFIGVSGIEDLFKLEAIKTMNKNPIVFALTNPYPEINPHDAKKGGAKIVATGSFLYKNTINNAIVFPYLMRSILDLKIKKITMEVLYATSLAVAKTISDQKLSPNNIIPSIENKSLQKNITKSLKNLKS
ncbi:malic enzyme, NAD binding domain protein [Candidatus Nitrosopumilus salaria BD31]|uniref:Malic enzyme, NAD binding domain protein n=1 Tax=Candidatus Nitrosopumilus salarius BD31 TaxID=859350 RepID=I3D352_9ARCH|nr:malic enzyme-like NAD(P)-binding protein [Candidatus Nitrosopumilus salaria]EIJ66145.1 malic enzyme, NAD binding domain protein [Candidatus Nitrosopumilus salaria BD31]